MSLIANVTGVPARAQAPMLLIGIGHGGTHLVTATFLILLPFIKEELGLSYFQAGLLVTVFHAASFCANLVSGLVVDMSGRRVVFQITALMVGALGLVGFGHAGGFLSLALLIALIGAANNLWHPAAISYISNRFPDNRGYALSIHALGANLGDAVAPLLASVLLVALTWRATAAISALPSLLLALLLLAVLRPTGARDEERAGLGAGDYFSGLKQVITTPSVMLLCCLAGIRSLGQSGIRTFLPLYLVQVMAMGPALYGATLFSLQMGGVLASPVAGIWSDRIGRRSVVLAGLGLSTVALLLLTLIGDAVLFIAGVSLLGFALFAVRPVMQGWLMDLTPPELGGSATSLMFGVQTIFAVTVPAVGGLIADAWGLIVVFYCLGATMCLANLPGYLLPKDDPRAIGGNTDPR